MSEAGAQISDASIADVDEICALSRKTYADAFGGDFTPDDLAYYLNHTLTAERWRDHLSRDRVLLARIAGKAVGFLQFGPISGEDGIEIRRVYVDAAFQGQGIGSGLLMAALTASEVEAAAQVIIDVWEANNGAKRLYERFGFADEGARKPFVFKGKVEGYDQILVRRPTSSSARG